MTAKPTANGHHRLKSKTMSKIETTSKVSLKLLSRINLRRRGTRTPSSQPWAQLTSPTTALKGARAASQIGTMKIRHHPWDTEEPTQKNTHALQYYAKARQPPPEDQRPTR